MVGLLILRSGLLWLREVLAQRAANLTKAATRDRLLAHIHGLGPTYVVGERSGELTNTLISGVEALDGYMALYQPARFLAGLVPVFVLLVILWIDPWTTLVLLFAGPILDPPAGLHRPAHAHSDRAALRRHELDERLLPRHAARPAHAEAVQPQPGAGRQHSRPSAEQFGRTTMDVLRTAFQTSLVLEWGATAATALVAVEVSLRLMAGLIPFCRSAGRPAADTGVLPTLAAAGLAVPCRQ